MVSKNGTLTRDNTLAAGDVSYTGLGFKPTSIIFLADLATNKSRSYGLVDSTGVGNGLYQTDVPQSGQLYDGGTGICIFAQSSANNLVTAKIKSFDADGFTLTWTKTGSPTGTTQVAYMAFK